MSQRLASKKNARRPSKTHPAAPAPKRRPKPAMGQKPPAPLLKTKKDLPAPLPDATNRELPGTDELPVGPDDSWRRIAVARAQAFDQGGPAYLLDDNYYFLDWNAAFDVLVAGPLGLKRTQSHAEDFVRALKNVSDVFERSKRVFAPGRAPQLDREKLIFESERYGEIEFDKLAVQVFDPNVELAAWAVYLNIARADRENEVWEDIGRRLQKELHWARYALSYDKLLLEFDDYRALLKAVVRRLENCRRCLDLGAGTGSGTLELLRSRSDREVWAVESNHSMIVQALDKISRGEREDRRNYFGRLRICKEDILRLDEVNVLPTDFDGAMLANVLYTLDDPGGCLKDIGRYLRPGGTLVLSTPHSGTDVNALFERMRDVLEQRGVWEQLRSLYNDALARNLEMNERIHRDTIADIERYVTSAGFRLQGRPEPAYAGAVVVVEAIKR